MKRVYTKPGDVFSVQIDENTKKYMQYIANDLTQLNSDVIRAFKRSYPIDAIPELTEIINDDIDFYAHCILKFGLKLNVWEKVGFYKDVGSIYNILFRGTSDYGYKKGDERIKISNNWHVWNINDDKFRKVGKLEGENKKAEIGLVLIPYDIPDRMKTGEYKFAYPGYE